MNALRPKEDEGWDPTTPFERNLVFAAGVGGLLFVPVFKTVTHLPPFMGMMMSLGVLWMLTERLHRTKTLEEKSHLTVIGVLRKIDSASMLFFLGILLAVARVAGSWSFALRRGLVAHEPERCVPD